MTLLARPRWPGQPRYPKPGDPCGWCGEIPQRADGVRACADRSCPPIPYLDVYTARYSYRGPDRVDTTRYHKGADTWGIAFAPPRWLLDVAKGYSGALSRLPRGVEAPPADDAGAWDWYAGHYRAAMLAGYGTRSAPGPHRAAWERLLAMPEATLVCFCPSPDQCHRGLLAAYVARLGAVPGGER